MEYLLGDLASRVLAGLRGDAGRVIHGVADLEHAGPGELSFLASASYRHLLARTRAGAVVLAPQMADRCPVDCLVVADPYSSFARLSRLFERVVQPAPGVHATAVVSASARVHPGASIGAHCTVEDEAEVGEGSVLGPGCHLGAGSRVGRDSRLWSRVTLYPGVRIGDRVRLHAGVVVGADGFGYAPAAEGWERIAQLGSVRIGDDVEIGAGSTIDRGTLGDTVIEQGVKIDNLVQIGHNARIGAHTAIAGCAGVAGSVRIGRHCRIGGGAGLVGHIEIADRVTITPMSLVNRSIAQAGTYTSGTSLQPAPRWRRAALRFAELDEISRRLRRLERRLRGAPPLDPHEEEAAGC